MDIQTLRDREQSIKSLAFEAAVGEQISGAKCPFCGGGHGHEKSLSVTRTQTAVFYRCHRNSCGKHGTIALSSLDPIPNRTEATAKQKKRETVKEELAKWDFCYNMPKEVVDMLLDNYGITQIATAWAGIRWVTNKNRISIPIRRPDGRRIGFNARSLDGKQPKSLIYIEYPDYPLASYYLRPNCREIWIVEDQLSAIRASDYACAVAVLGTNITEGLMNDLRKQAFARVVICLDKDAKDKAIEYSQKYSGIVGHLSVRIPPKDLKDMTTNELIDFMEPGR